MPHEAVNLVIALLPELVLIGGGCLLVVALSRGPGRQDYPRAAAVMALLTVGLAVAAMLVPTRLPLPAAISLDATARAGRWAALLMGVLLTGAQFALPESRPGRTTEDRGSPEFFMLLLFSLAGLMLTASANDIIVLFLALELTSVPTFVAVALSRPQHSATEAAGKYFFLGALSAAFMLMGLAYLFGLTGRTSLEAVAVPGRLGAVAIIAMAMLLAGVGFKIAAFPYHVYVADVYQGAAAPVAGWLSFVPKAAGFLALGKILVVMGGPALAAGAGWLSQPVWQHLVWLLAVLTMTAGNVLALWQHNVKRLLAYSSVAHSGYLLAGLLIVPDRSGYSVAAVVVFYLVAYGIASLGAFLVLATVRVADADGGTREAETFADLHGLGRRRAPLAIALAIFAFALMGLPPTVGFLAKVYVFIKVYKAGFTWLVVIALVNAAVGAAYYLRIIAACWMEGDEPATGEQAAEPAAGTDAARQAPPGLVILILAAATICFGLFPRALYNRLTTDTKLPQRAESIEIPALPSQPFMPTTRPGNSN